MKEKKPDRTEKNSEGINVLDIRKVLLSECLTEALYRKHTLIQNNYFNYSNYSNTHISSSIVF